jgi:hypothetical protein
MGSSLQSLEGQYMLLTQNLSMILAACTTQQERDAVMEQYVAARRNYWNSITKIFHDDDPAVSALVKEMSAEQTQIESCMNQLNAIARVIRIITDAVTIGTALVAKAG